MTAGLQLATSSPSHASPVSTAIGPCDQTGLGGECGPPRKMHETHQYLSLPSRRTGGAAGWAANVNFPGCGGYQDAAKDGLLGLRMAPVPNGDEMAIPSWWAVPRFRAIRGLELQNRTPKGRIDGEIWPMLPIEKKNPLHPQKMHSMSHTGIPGCPLLTSKIIHVDSENGNQQTTTSARDWATPDECPSSDRHCMCGQSRCPTGELEVLECYCMGPAICGLGLASLPSSREPPLPDRSSIFGVLCW